MKSSNFVITSLILMIATVRSSFVKIEDDLQTNKDNFGMVVVSREGETPLPLASLNKSNDQSASIMGVPESVITAETTKGTSPPPVLTLGRPTSKFRPVAPSPTLRTTMMREKRDRGYEAGHLKTEAADLERKEISGETNISSPQASEFEDKEEEISHQFFTEKEPGMLSGAPIGITSPEAVDKLIAKLPVQEVKQIRIQSADDLLNVGQPLCRSREKFLPPDLYGLDSCALCYSYIQNPDLFVKKWLIRESLREVEVNNDTFAFKVAVLRNPQNMSHEVEAEVNSTEILASFSGDDGQQKWRTCCSAATSCCGEMLTSPWPAGNCPPTWDGWQCWLSTSPGTQASGPCPSYSYYGKAVSCTKMATKQCQPEGRWFRRGGGGGGPLREWSNYSSCSVAESIIRRLYVHIAAYSASVAALLPALCIFFSYKQLRAHRISLHKHLFISLLLEAVCNISFKLLLLHQKELIQENPLWCILLNLLSKYSSLTTYMWYLCEGYYLHKLLASAFAEQNSLVTFYLIGWGFPMLLLTIYAGIRSLGSYNAVCWSDPVEMDWIIKLPPLLAIVVNIIFMVNIIRILVGKVRATNSDEPSQYRKAVRATMMVIPLFGLQCIITIYRPAQLGCDWPELYQIINNVIEGSTGAIVALIFCYTNSEVLTLLSRSLQRYRAQRKFGNRRKKRTSPHNDLPQEIHLQPRTSSESQQ